MIVICAQGSAFSQQKSQQEVIYNEELMQGSCPRGYYEQISCLLFPQYSHLSMLSKGIHVTNIIFSLASSASQEMLEEIISDVRQLFYSLQNNNKISYKMAKYNVKYHKVIIFLKYFNGQLLA